MEENNTRETIRLHIHSLLFDDLFENLTKDLKDYTFDNVRNPVEQHCWAEVVFPISNKLKN